MRNLTLFYSSITHQFFFHAFLSFQVNESNLHNFLEKHEKDLLFGRNNILGKVLTFKTYTCTHTENWVS